jgi:hypothetical protein
MQHSLPRWMDQQLSSHGSIDDIVPDGCVFHRESIYYSNGTIWRYEISRAYSFFLVKSS